MQLEESRCDDLDDCAEEVLLKLALWQGSAEFDSITSSWSTTHFESLDVASLEEQMAR
jgi:hypothetical protein